MVDVFDSTFEAGVKFMAAEIQASNSGKHRSPGIDGLQGAGPGETRRNLISLLIGVSANLITSREINPLLSGKTGSGGSTITAKEYLDDRIEASGLSSVERVRFRRFIDHDIILREALERTTIYIGHK